MKDLFWLDPETKDLPEPFLAGSREEGPFPARSVEEGPFLAGSGEEAG